MDKVELKPCPWCPEGGAISSGEALSNYPDGRTSIQTGCTECGAMGPERNTAEEADAAWNTRALEAENAALKAQVAHLESLIADIAAVAGRDTPDAIDNEGQPYQSAALAVAIERAKR